MRRIIAVATIFLALAASPVAAQNTRSFVSPIGNDANACTLAAPCRTFAGAYALTNAGGEIAVLGTAGYGSLTISKAISIVNGGGFEAGVAVPSGGVGITINAGAGAVTLRGLTIDGAGVGYNGIVVTSAGNLTISNCTVQNFGGGLRGGTGTAILIQPNSGTMNFVVVDTVASHNANFGLAYYASGGTPSAHGVIDRVLATDNAYGIYLDTQFTTGGANDVAVSNSIASNNNTGIWIGNGNGNLSVSIDNTAASGNSFGISAYANPTSPKVLLGRSAITSNSQYGVMNQTSSGTFYTYQDNRINLNGNGNNVSGSALVGLTFQ